MDRAKITQPFGYILKPFDERELQVVIETAIYKHRAEQDLIEREGWLDAVLMSIGDAVVTTDAEGAVTFVNPRAESLTGWTMAEAGGQPLSEVVSLIREGTRESIEAPVVRAIKEMRQVLLQDDAILISRNRTERAVDDAAAPIVDADGTPRGGVMVFRDVTDKKLAQDRERQSLVLRQSILDSFPANVAVLDRAGTIVLTNGKWDQFATDNGGRVEDAGVGTNYLHVCRTAAASGDRLAASALSGLEGVLHEMSGQFSLDYLCTPPDHRWFRMLAVPLAREAGGAIVLHLEVSEQKASEASVHMLSSLVEQSEDAVVGMTPEGIVTSWNSGATRLYGYEASEIVGKNVSDLFFPDRIADLRAALAQVRAGSWVRPFEIPQRRKDATTASVSMSISPVRGAGSDLIGASAIAHDITEVARLREQLRHSQKMEVVGRLAGGVAHDFNNLLTIINGYTGFLLEVVDQPDDAREMLRHVQEAGERAARLTAQLLAFSRKMVQEPRRFDINELIRSLQNTLMRLIGADVRLTAVLDPSPCHVRVDRTQMEQVLLNLAVNARDAMPGGGSLTVSSRHVDLQEGYDDEFSVIRAGDHVLVEVADTGSGIPPETLPHIFEPFFTTKPQGKGTGLGLATVYGIVKQSGGHIQVSSDSGVGTTFRIYLPCDESGDDVASQETPDVGAATGAETILVAEDEEAVRSFTTRVLAERGYRVLSASSGSGALALARQHAGTIDLLLADVVMPGMGGLALAMELRTFLPALKVLYVSGYAGDSVPQIEENLLMKPFSPEELLRRLREALDAAL